MILKQNITLPSYQRRFVWTDKNVKALIKAFEENQFVPPITIGAFTIDGKPQNLILDGQQRLTSILLAYLGRYPNKTKQPLRGYPLSGCLSITFSFFPGGFAHDNDY